MADPAQKKLSKKELKDVVQPIILSQGNKFIKELLRRHDLPIGATKADFSKNVMAAIDDGKLTQDLIEEWLAEVDGWGNQHIYLFEPPALDRNVVEERVRGSEHGAKCGQAATYEFPDTLELTTITVDANFLNLGWHVGNSGWVRAKSKDYQADEGGDRFEYRAFRQRYNRSVVRFEWHFDNPYCALLIQLPNEGDVHQQTRAKVYSDMIDIGLIDAPLNTVTLSKAIKALNRNPDVVVQSARMTADGGHVDLVATLLDGGIGEVEAVRQVQRAVDDTKFASADGMFNFKTEKHAGLSRAVKVQGYGADNRLRVWVQCKREDIYLLLGIVWDNN